MHELGKLIRDYASSELGDISASKLFKLLEIARMADSDYGAWQYDKDNILELEARIAELQTENLKILAELSELKKGREEKKEGEEEGEEEVIETLEELAEKELRY